MSNLIHQRRVEALLQQKIYGKALKDATKFFTAGVACSVLPWFCNFSKPVNFYFSVLGTASMILAVPKAYVVSDEKEVLDDLWEQYSELKSTNDAAELKMYDIFAAQKIEAMTPKEVEVISTPEPKPWAQVGRQLENVFKKLEKEITVIGDNYTEDAYWLYFMPKGKITISSVMHIDKKVLDLELKYALGCVGAEITFDEDLRLGLRIPRNPVVIEKQTKEPVLINNPSEQPSIDVSASTVDETYRPPQNGVSFTVGARPQSTVDRMAANESEVFSKFLKAPHNWICGKTNSGKTFLLLRLVWDWLNANPGGELIICDRNYGKPDRETGEVFDWNGIDERVIYSADADILTVLLDQKLKLEQDIARFDEYTRRRSRAMRDGLPFDEAQPERRKVLIVITEFNALTGATKTGAKAETSPVIEAVSPILDQGNGYRIKLIFDGQTIAVGRSGISESLRMQTSICMVGDNCTNVDEVSQLGTGSTKKLIQECAEIKSQGRRPCIIQIGEGLPIAAVVPHMPYLRNPEYRFDNVELPRQPNPLDDGEEFDEWDDQYEEKFGNEPEDDIKKSRPKTIEDLVNVLKLWIEELGRLPDDKELANQIYKLSGEKLNDKGLLFIKEKLGLS